MDMAALIAPDGVLPVARIATKKRTLQELSRRAAMLTGMAESAVFDALSERERLGSTGVGLGVAIPHAKLPGLGRMVGLFVRLDRPIPFDAIDGAPVDLLFTLLAPEDATSEHLTALARVSRLLRDRQTCAKLRGTDTEEGLYALLTASDGATG